MCSRRSLFLKVPWTRRNNSRTCKRPCTRGSAKRSAAARCSPTVTGFCMSWNAASPMKQSWPVRWTSTVMVDHPCRLYDPGIGRARALTAATLRPHDARFFLRLADIQHAFVLLELPHVPLRDVVFALAPHSRRLPRCSDSVSYVTYFGRAGEAISMPLDVKVWGGRPWEPQPPPASAGVGKPA